MIGQIAGAVFFAGAARAEDAALEPGRHAETPLAQRALRLSLGTGLTFGLSDVETQQSDVVEMSSSAYLWNVHAAASYRLGSVWALGVRGSWSSDAGARTSASSSTPAFAPSLRRAASPSSGRSTMKCPTSMEPR